MNSTESLATGLVEVQKVTYKPGTENQHYFFNENHHTVPRKYIHTPFPVEFFWGN